jgi:NAD(P)-dependent dehydrogenase (short-subunit alcohol dehydrogenase family)
MKTIIVTGANSGLGLWTSQYLLEEKYFVIMACRNTDKAKEDIKKIKAFQEHKNFVIKHLDLADLENIKSFVDGLTELTELHGLICNAGITYEGEFRYTKDGIEETFGVNHLGHFYLTQLLLEKFSLQKIVIISSALHDPANQSPFEKAVYKKVLDMAYPQIDKSRNLAKQTQEFYCTSKLCNVLFAYELARRLKGKAIVNAYNPGFMPSTNFGRTQTITNLFFRKALYLIGSLFGFATTPQKSARHVVRLITDETESGKYFDNDKPVKSSTDSYDESKAIELWQQSEQLINTIVERK